LSGTSHAHGLPGQDVIYSLDGKPITPTTQTVRVCARCGTAYEGLRCPECGYQREPDAESRALRIYSAELREVFAGHETPGWAQANEWARLAQLAISKGWALQWALREYDRLFGARPQIGQSEIAYERARLERVAAEKGYKRGWVWHRLKALQ